MRSIRKILASLSAPFVALGLCFALIACESPNHPDTASVDEEALSASCPNSRGFVPANTSIPIDHILVLVQENHSFDSYFGKLNDSVYSGEVDGLSTGLENPDRSGTPVAPWHATSYCPTNPPHGFAEMNDDWDGGKNDHFAINGGRAAMAYFDQSDLPYYYGLASAFAIADRYFASTLTPTDPNRYFLIAATAFGKTGNNPPLPPADARKTIFYTLNKKGISWKYYSGGRSYLSIFFPSMVSGSSPHAGSIGALESDLSHGTLPEVVFIDAPDGYDEHPPDNVRKGQHWVADIIGRLMTSPVWAHSALFLTYDEGGGLFDHVPPVAVCDPDGAVTGQYTRSGFRVPLTVVSPYAKRHYVSHVNYDHGSILKFIETRFHLPALSRRDANADAMLDLFDFDHPDTSIPSLPSAPYDPSAPCPVMQ